MTSWAREYLCGAYKSYVEGNIGEINCPQCGINEMETEEGILSMLAGMEDYWFSDEEGLSFGHIAKITCGNAPGCLLNRWDTFCAAKSSGKPPRQ